MEGVSADFGEASEVLPQSRSVASHSQKAGVVLCHEADPALLLSARCGARPRYSGTHLLTVVQRQDQEAHRCESQPLDTLSGYCYLIV